MLILDVYKLKSLSTNKYRRTLYLKMFLPNLIQKFRSIKKITPPKSPLKIHFLTNPSSWLHFSIAHDPAILSLAEHHRENIFPLFSIYIVQNTIETASRGVELLARLDATPLPRRLRAILPSPPRRCFYCFIYFYFFIFLFLFLCFIIILFFFFPPTPKRVHSTPHAAQRASESCASASRLHTPQTPPPPPKSIWIGQMQIKVSHVQSTDRRGFLFFFIMAAEFPACSITCVPTYSELIRVPGFSAGT